MDHTHKRNASPPFRQAPPRYDCDRSSLCITWYTWYTWYKASQQKIHLTQTLPNEDACFPPPLFDHSSWQQWSWRPQRGCSYVGRACSKQYDMSHFTMLSACHTAPEISSRTRPVLCSTVPYHGTGAGGNRHFCFWHISLETPEEILIYWRKNKNTHTHLSYDDEIDSPKRTSIKTQLCKLHVILRSRALQGVLLLSH